MSIATILDSIVAGLTTAVPVLKTCEVIGGNLDIAEALRRSYHAPAVFVFCAGTEDAQLYQNKVKTRAEFVAVVVTSSRLEAPPIKNDRARVAATIAGRVLYAVLTADDWGNSEVDGCPVNADSDNRYTTSSDKANVNIWTVSWEQSIALEKDPADPALDNLEKILATWELQDGTTPAEDAVDEIDMTP